MSFVISCVLACTTILATCMLQLADDELSRSSAAIGFISLFAILIALYFVDYKRKFSINKTQCNVLLIIAVVLQIGPLLNSRDEIIAFAIANILATLQAILFFQSKTIRKCYQILFISFVEVAVGCVFQRSAFFVASLPIYAILAFMCISLLFLWSERKFYSESVVLKNRFYGNNSLQMISAEEPINQLEEKPLDAFDSAAALAYSKRSKIEDSSRFFRRPSIPAIHFRFDYFSRFVYAAFIAFVFAAVFFSVFPRLDRIGSGPLSFENISWGNDGGRRVTRTGFNTKIELGDLGPALDSHEAVMTVQLVDCLDKNEKFPIDPLSIMYFRGMPLVNYSDRSWVELHSPVRAQDLSTLEYWLQRDSLADPDFVLSYLIKFQDRRESAFNNRNADVATTEEELSSQAQDQPYLLYRPQGQRGYGSPLRARPSPVVRTEPDAATQEMYRAPHLGNLASGIPEQRQFSNFDAFDSIKELPDLVERNLLSLRELAYDTRNDIVGYDVTLNPLDTPIVFFPTSSYFAKAIPNVFEMSNSSLKLFVNRGSESPGGKYWFVSTGVRNRRQTALEPNRELIWPYLAQYLAIDQDKFPTLIAKAKAWDAESRLPKENFVGRARYFESKLRDTGEFAYNRVGVARNQSVDPLEDFISEHKEGHCEYFAGGLALMLRAVGIPARVVVGFACYPSKDGKPTIVRQSDAHSWVEAYIPPDKLPKPTDGGAANLFAGSATDARGMNFLPKSNMEWVNDGMWLRLDATPASDRDSDRPDALTLGIYTWSRLFRSFGRDFVLNFNAAQQMRTVYTPLLRFWRQCVAAVQSFQGFFDFAKEIFLQYKDAFTDMLTGNWTPAAVLRFSIFLAITLVIIGFSSRLYKSFKKGVEERRKKAELEAKKPRRDSPAALLYLRLEKSLETKLKIKRDGAETPREFIERCFIVEDKLVNEREYIRARGQENDAKPGKRVVRIFAKSSKQDVREDWTPTSAQNRSLFRELVEIYYRSQFGDKGLSQQETERWVGILKEARVA